jgi:hypothetical protein
MPQLKLRPPKLLFETRASGFTGVHTTDFAAPACGRQARDDDANTDVLELSRRGVFGRPAGRARDGARALFGSPVFNFTLKAEKPKL